MASSRYPGRAWTPKVARLDQTWWIGEIGKKLETSGKLDLVAGGIRVLVGGYQRHLDDWEGFFFFFPLIAGGPSSVAPGN